MRKEATKAGRLGMLIFVILAACIMFFAKPAMANSYSDAFALPMDGNWVTNISAQYNDYIWYKFTANSDGMFVLKYRFRSGGYISGYLVSEDFQTTYYKMGAGANASDVPSQHEFDIGIGRGTYFLKIANTGMGDVVNLDISASFTSYQLNDQNAVSFDSPQNYCFGGNTVGAVTTMKDTDWYKFTVPSNRTLEMKISSTQNFVYWYICNSDLQTTKSGYLYSDGKTPKTETETFSLDGGEYYLKIKGNDNPGSEGNTVETNRTIYGASYSFIIKDVTPAPQTEAPSTPSTPATPSVTPSTPSTPVTPAVAPAKPSTTTTKAQKVKTFKAAAKKITLRVAAGKKKAKATWKKITGASGYQIRYSKKKSMKGSKTVRIAGAKKTSRIIKRLTAKKKYYFQIRAYKVINGKTYYGAWSTKKAAKIKK